MARKEQTIVTYTDDLDGTELTADELVEVHFAHNGDEWTLDLSEKNAKKLSDFLEPYMAAGRPVRRPAAPNKRKKAGVGGRDTGGRDLNEVRKWARESGFAVSDRGRVPGNIVEAYDAAH